MLETTRARARERAQAEAKRTKETAREELGRVLFDFVEAYFPEQASSRRKGSNWRVLAIGLVLGVYLGRRILR